MFDFGNANDGQRQAIATADGPVLITAGPGTGKTYTLVQRTIYLIEECDVRPESIFIATFTEKAAKELVTRITNELASRNITANINEMYIGTFHALCLRILKEHLEYTRLRRNYRLMDSFDQQYKKSFHADTYCFDSIPEKECFMQYITSVKVAEVYFTGMFTSNQGDLSVHYYDPESGRIRQYYPDFLAKMTDGSYQLIEVKGDNKIDDTVVKAKKAAAEEMAVASGVKYLMYASSQVMHTHILEEGAATTQNMLY